MAYDMEPSDICEYDIGYLEVFNGSVWVVVVPTPGYDYLSTWCGNANWPNWIEYTADVSNHARGNSNFRVGFYFDSDAATEYYGMYIDMVELLHSE